jgi:hypothetical protein
VSAATLTVNRQCTRCPRIDQAEISVDDVVKMAQSGKKSLPNGPKALNVRIDEKTVIEFDFLCGPCKQIVLRYIEHAAKKPKHQSALRGDQKIEVEED